MSKKKRNKPTGTKPPAITERGDFGTPELHMRRAVKVSSTPQGRRAYVQDQLYIDTLHNRGHISEHQHDAGTRIFEFYVKAGRFPMRAMPLDAIRVDSSVVNRGMFDTESQVHFWGRLNDALSGMETITRLIVLRACCYESMADELTRDLTKPRFYVLERLREGLDIVALNLGIISAKQYERTIQTHRMDRFMEDSS